MKNLGIMMKQVQEMQARMADMQARLDELTVTGQAGAGMVILRMLEREGLRDHVVVVTRWYGGVKLGGDRFRRVQDCVRAYLDLKA